jgi:hypothetical protein
MLGNTGIVGSPSVLADHTLSNGLARLARSGHTLAARVDGTHYSAIAMTVSTAAGK